MKINLQLIKGYLRPILLLTGGLALYNTYSFSSDMTQTFRQMPIDGMMTESKKSAVPPDLSNLPLLVGHADGAASKTSAESSNPLDLDAAFTPPLVEKKDSGARTDYFLRLPEELSITAVSPTGVIFEGRFCNAGYVRYGQTIDGCEYPGENGRIVTPVLLSSDNDGALIREPGSNRTVKVPF
jgi:hypothetical protein